MEIVGLRGERVRLVPVDRTQHLDNAIRWVNDPEVNRHIGFTGLHAIDWRNRRANSGLVIGDKEAWGRGYATDAMRVRTKFAFETLNLHRVESEALADNEASQKALERVGYRREGVFRERFWSEGRWHDTIWYAILDEDYFASREGARG